MQKRLLGGLAVMVFSAQAPAGELIEIDPFTGHSFEGFESFEVNAYSSMDVFTLNAFGGAGGLVTPIGDEQNNPLLTVLRGIFFQVNLKARTGDRMMGSLWDDVGIAPAVRWVFDTPARRFGGYFGAIGLEKGATALLFDENNNLLGQHEIDVPLGDWAWNGWKAEGAGIARIDVFSNSQFGPGLVFYDDFQYDPVPAPPAGLALVGFFLARSRRSRGRS